MSCDHYLMLSHPELRRLLGQGAEGLSDKEIERIAACCEFWAASIFEWWRRSRNGHIPKPDSQSPHYTG